MYNDFSLDETLNFFGYLHDLNTEKLEKRKEFLIKFLDLDGFKKSIVKQLRYIIKLKA